MGSKHRVRICHLDGNVIGIVGNQPLVLAGVLDIESSSKAARFVRTCDAFNIPLTLVDVPGFSRSDQEYGGIIRHGAKLLYAYWKQQFPHTGHYTKSVWRSVCCYGFKISRVRLSFAWPTAELAVMGPKEQLKFSIEENFNQLQILKLKKQN